jgi:PAS domain S-box-containing protein
LISLFQNLAVIIVLAFLFGQVLHRFERLARPLRQGLCGLLFGMLAILCMTLPLHPAPGVIIDLRSVAVLAAAPFGGPLAGLVAGGLAVAYRVHLGGVGVWPGVAVVLMAMLIGQILASRARQPVPTLHAMAAGLLLAAGATASFLLLPDRAEAYQLMTLLGPAMALLFPLATAVLWLLLRTEARRHAAQRALQVSEARFRDIAEAATDWFWEMGSDLRVRYISSRFHDVTGVDPQTLVGRRRDEMWSGLGVPDFATHNADLAAQRSFRDFVYPIRLKDGSLRHLSINGKPIYDAGGAFAGYRGSGHDITAEVEAREQLVAAQRAAEDANRAKSAFLAQMSHELRTPLNAILGFSEVMRKEVFGPVGTPSYLEYASYIYESGEHLLQLINDVLDLSKVEAGRYELAPERCRLGELIDGVVLMVEHKAAEMGVRLRHALPANLPEVEVDPRLMRQVLLNLVSNGVKFTETGGEVALSVRRLTGGGLEIVVADTGIGMDQQDTQLVLQPFVQAKGRPRNIEGTGLGLPLAQGLVERHGGRLEIDSAPGRGTTVTVRLPAARVLPPG